MVDLFLTTRTLHLYVVDTDGRLLGVVDLHDLKEVMGGDLSAPVIAADVVSEVPYVLRDEPLSSVNAKLWLRDYGQLPVVESAETRRFLGVVTRRDILGAVDREILGRSALLARVSHPAGPSDEVDYFEPPENHRLGSVEAPQDLVGKTLAESRLREDHDVLVLALARLRPDGTVHRFLPKPSETIRRGDRLVVLAPEEALRELAGG